MVTAAALTEEWGRSARRKRGGSPPPLLDSGGQPTPAPPRETQRVWVPNPFRSAKVEDSTRLRERRGGVGLYPLSYVGVDDPPPSLHERFGGRGLHPLPLCKGGRPSLVPPLEAQRGVSPTPSSEGVTSTFFIFFIFFIKNVNLHT